MDAAYIFASGLTVVNTVRLSDLYAGINTCSA